MLDRPHNTVHEELELRWRQREKSGEAVQVDSPQELEEANAVLRELREVLVDHVERRLEYSIQDRRDLRRKKVLVKRISVVSCSEVNDAYP